MSIIVQYIPLTIMKKVDILLLNVQVKVIPFGLLKT